MGIIKWGFWVYLLWLGTGTKIYGGTIRDISVGPNEIVTVNTSLGLSTMIELPKNLKSLVVGDLDAFRVEYAGQSVAIKPLLAGARSNLFVSTSQGNYRFELRVVAQGLADYVIRISQKKKRLPTEAQGGKSKKNIAPNKTTHLSSSNATFSAKASSDSLDFSIQRVSRYNQEKKLGIAITIFNRSSTFKLRPEDIHVIQAGKEVPIFLLALDSPIAQPTMPVAGLIVVNDEDFAIHLPLTVMFSPAILSSQSGGLKIALNLSKSVSP